VSVAAQQPCGGSERWAVKVCADPDSQINLQPIPISIHDLSPVQLGPLPNNDVDRLPTERKVYVVDGFWVKFKREAGKTGDSDYHLGFTDETLTFASGANNPDSTHSVIAEIVDPDCVMGPNNTVSSPSIFASEMNVSEQMPNMQLRSTAWIRWLVICGHHTLHTACGLRNMFDMMSSTADVKTPFHACRATDSMRSGGGMLWHRPAIQSSAEASLAAVLSINAE
jgi:hypothetical protein